jgi:capsular exopolysaccharide synthesis family protein
MEFLKIWEILLRRKWIVISVFLTFFIAVVFGTHLVAPTYKARAKLLVETSDSLSSLLAALGLQALGAGATDTSDEDYETDIALATIRPLLEELISSLDLRDRAGKVMEPDDLIGSSLINKIFPQPHLKVDQYEDADMLEIISTSSNPSEASNMSNKLTDLYINDMLDRTREEYKAAKIFIEDQIQKVKEEYYKSLAALRDFQIREKTVNLNLETQNLINKIATLKSSYEDNERRILELGKEAARVKEKLKEREKYRKESEEFTQSDQIRSLKTKLNELLVSISGKSIDFSIEHPEYRQLEKEVDTAKELIKKEAKVVFDSERFSVDPIYDELSRKLIEGYIDREVNIAKRELLQQYIDEYQDELLKLPLKSIENSKLELAISVNKEMYQNLLEYLTQVGIAESMTLSDVRIVEPAATPDKPNFPKKPLNYALGLFLGLFWGLAVAFFIEYIDNSIKSPEDIKHIKDLTLLGTIPKSRFLKNLGTISNLDPTSHVLEAFRTIKDNIQHACVDKEIKSIVVTSAAGQEGKSSVASNISTIFTMGEKNVILVDFDLRNPSIHKFFGVSNKKGIANVLAEDLDLEEAILHTNIKGLYLLPSGPIPPDPGRLLESQKVKNIILRLSKKFHMVIIDTPPAIAVNDPIVVGRFADGTLLVIECGKATFSMVEHVKERIERANLNLIGAILNKYKAHHSGYYGYY